MRASNLYLAALAFCLTGLANRLHTPSSRASELQQPTTSTSFTPLRSSASRLSPAPSRTSPSSHSISPDLLTNAIPRGNESPSGVSVIDVKDDEESQYSRHTVIDARNDGMKENDATLSRRSPSLTTLSQRSHSRDDDGDIVVPDAGEPITRPSSRPS